VFIFYGKQTNNFQFTKEGKMKQPRFMILVCSFIFIAMTIMTTGAFATTNCPPASLAPNPSPVVKGSGTGACIASANWVELKLNESWTKQVNLKGGRGYWFSASKCARARSISGEIRDASGKVLKSGSGAGFGFCFKPPKDGTYSVTYKVTGLNGSYSFAITNACLSESNCN
jgi:hypothetical protein